MLSFSFAVVYSHHLRATSVQKNIFRPIEQTRTAEHADYKSERSNCIILFVIKWLIAEGLFVVNWAADSNRISLSMVSFCCDGITRTAAMH